LHKILQYLHKYYIIKTIETELENNDNNVYFKLEKKLNYFLNVKSIMTYIYLFFYYLYFNVFD